MLWQKNVTGAIWKVILPVISANYVEEYLDDIVSHRFNHASSVQSKPVCFQTRLQGAELFLATGE